MNIFLQRKYEAYGLTSDLATGQIFEIGTFQKKAAYGHSRHKWAAWEKALRWERTEPEKA